MSAKSDKIPFCVKLPNKLFWSFIAAAKEVGETRSTIVKRQIRRFVRKTIKDGTVLP